MENKQDTQKEYYNIILENKQAYGIMGLYKPSEVMGLYKPSELQCMAELLNKQG